MCFCEFHQGSNALGHLVSAQSSGKLLQVLHHLDAERSLLLAARCFQLREIPPFFCESIDLVDCNGGFESYKQ